ncbi:MAG: hypothetical protein KDD76_00790 [Rickettsiales bacterium]|nr:hypothetical protein [Rickettsiales bacterium]
MVDISNLLGAASGTTSAYSQSDRSLSALSEDFDSFLKLLTTQLKNQDPTAPLDSNDFTDQVTAFSGVEQQVKTNKYLEQLLTIQTGSKLSSAASFIGKFAETSSDKVVIGEENGAEIAYEVDGTGLETNIIITNEQGIQVFNGKGKTESGRHVGFWDGNDDSGNRVPAGIYTVEVTSKSLDGNVEDVTSVYTKNLVTGVQLGEGEEGVNLVLAGDITVPFDQVRYVTQY